MSLKRLELVGFKSFMSPVTLDFREGITAILGPNGCGKTNIVDAVRWVLGEQSARQLRSTKMENVIFNGTQVHKPTGYALVNMTINNERGSFPLDYSEITITRKVYRSGISEYFINKSPCRLKDIKELFADTGTGSHSYAVIEQEMVEYVLNDAHGERRQMFEEASGIVKYRMRREEAKRKLKLTESDLIRLEDIIEELDKNVRSLRYQVGKTKRYKRISERIRHWGLVRIRKSLSEYLGEKRVAEKSLNEALDISRKGDYSLDAQEKRVEEEKLGLVGLEKRNTGLQNSRYEVRRRIQSSEEKIIQFTERKGEAERKIERAILEVEEAKARLSKISERLEGVRIEQEVTAERIAQEEETVKSLGGRFEEISIKTERLQTELIDLKQTQLDFLQDQVRVKSSQEHYESLLRELDSRSSQMRERIVALETEVDSDSSAKEDGERRVKERKESLQKLEEGLAVSQRSVEDIESRLLESEAGLAAMNTEMTGLASRQELFARMKEDFEGFPGGARYVLKKTDSRVRGPLAEIINVRDEYRQALEAVLGGMVDGVVVEDLGGAIDLIREVSEKRLGGVRFFIENTESRVDEVPAGQIPGLIGRLSDLVTVEDSKKRMIDDLLGGTMLFEERTKALDFISSDRGRDFDAVTLDGIYFCRGKGIYFSGKDKDDVSILARGEEIERINRRIEGLRKNISRQEDLCLSLRKEKESLREEISRTKDMITSGRDALARETEEYQEAHRSWMLKKEKCSLLMRSLDELEGSRVETLSKLEEAKLALAMQQETGDTGRFSQLEAELASLGKIKSDLENSLTSKKVGLASLQGIVDKQKEEARGLTEMEKQFRNIMEQRTVEIADSREESERLARDVEQERAAVASLIDEEKEYQKELDELMGVLEEKRSAISVLEKDLKSRQEEREKVFDTINEFKIKLSSIDTRMHDLIERGADQYSEDLGYYLEGKEFPLTAEEMAVTQEMLEKEKRKLESLGAVNMAAVEEYEQGKERLEFLNSQKEDLVNAKAELEEAIIKINRRARKMFLETFNQVKVYFGEIFEVLFEGGEASLSLSEGSDPLEADIVITARPKGKRQQDISLLSGGERALTAMALLFALYKAKPSPFCIFDEVDAPLDDSNIQRFVRMLKKFSKETQFIIITHNKRTMQAAESLFGVTMEQKGVSNVVHVDMTEVESVLKNRKPRESSMAESTVSTN